VDSQLKIHWKAIVLGFVLALIISDIWQRWLDGNYETQKSVVIVALGGKLEIPIWYWLDFTAADAGISFTDFRKRGGRIAVGRKSELSSGFWDWVHQTKPTEQLRCGISYIEATANNIKSVILSDDKQFVMFVGVPDSVVENSVNGLCQSRKTSC
jgi:hypothetical protein